MSNGDALTIALMFGALVAVGALAYVIWAFVVFAREQSRAGAFTLRRRLIGYGALVPADDAQSAAVVELMATWQSFMRRAARQGWWAFGLAMGLVLAAVVVALATNLMSAAWLSAVTLCASLISLFGMYTGYLREFRRLPPDATSRSMSSEATNSTSAQAMRPLAAWRNRLLPLGPLLCIVAVTLYTLLATPSGVLTWDAGRTQTNRGWLMVMLGTLLIGFVASIYLGERLHAIGPRQLAPDPALSRRAELALRRYITNQRDFALLSLFCVGVSMLILLSNAGAALTLAPLALIGLAFWLGTQGRGSLV